MHLMYRLKRLALLGNPYILSDLSHNITQKLKQRKNAPSPAPQPHDITHSAIAENKVPSHVDRLTVMDNIEQVIFCIGAPRSGTTLLNSMLCNEHTYPMLPECSYITRLITHFNEIMHYSDVHRFNAYAAHKERLIEIYKKPIWDFIATAVHHQAPSKINKPLVLKDPMLSFQLNNLDYFFNKYKCIAILRDPRDIIASTIKVRKKQKSTINFKRMVHDLFQFFFLLDNFETQSPYLIVKYEDLVLNTQDTLRNIENFVTYPIYSDASSNYSFDTSDPTYSKNYGKAITSASVHNFKQELNRFQVQYIERCFAGFNKKYHLF